MVYTVGLALLVDTVDRDEVGAWMGSALSGMSAGVMIGPFVAGLIYAKAGYLAVFATILAIIGLDFILRLFMIEKQSARKWKAKQNYGTFSGEPHQHHRPINRDEVSAAAEGEIEGTPTDWQRVAKVDDFSPSDFKKPATDQPSDHRHGTRKAMVKCLKTIAILLKSREILAAMYGGFVQATLICAFDSILPLFVHKTFGWETTGGGSIFLALTIPALAAPLVGMVSDRLGARKLLRMGEEHYLLLGPGGAFAKAYGLLNTAVALGTMFGPAFAGLLYEREGWDVVVWAMAALCASGIIPVVRPTFPCGIKSYGINEDVLKLSKHTDLICRKEKTLVNKAS
ncbi:MAG: hypothetical protein Q9222_003533 [Ikaeria aurantiellina]